MEKYTDEELKEIKEIMQEYTFEATEELVKYTKDSEFIEDFEERFENEENLEEVMSELVNRIFSLVPKDKRIEFFKDIEVLYAYYIYAEELTKEYPEYFKYMMEGIANSSYYDNEILGDIFDFTDIR